MLRVERVLRSAVRLWFLTVLGLLIVAVPGAMAQFGLPKIPKVGKSSPASKAVQGPTPEVTAIAPSSVPQGWEGDVTFTGHNFSKTMKLRMECGSQSIKPIDFRVESGERAVFHLKVPPSAEETKCMIALEVPPVAPTAETGPTVQGTPQVVQVTGPTFSISESSTIAKAYQACFLAEGDVPPMELMMKLGQAMQKGSQDACKLYVSSDSIKYADQGKTLLDQSASAVKTVEQVLMMGNPTGIFRIVLTSGKIYNFIATGSQSRNSPLYEQIKDRLKK